MAIDVDRVRADTPGCSNVLHFNNAGAALPPQPVLDAQVEHLKLEAAIGGYEAEAEAKERLAHTYDSIARMLGCASEEVAIVENATRAWDMAFYGMPFQKGDRILTSRAAYASNHIACLQVAERTGAEVDIVPSDDTGQIDVDAFRSMIDDRVALIALTHVPTNSGLVNPAAEVGDVAEAFLPRVAERLAQSGVELRADEASLPLLRGSDAKVVPAGPDDFDQEWLALILGVRIVDSLDQAVDHIHGHSTEHSDSIVTNDWSNATRFVDRVNSSAVFVNASTRFNDGGQFGLGAEVAVSTQKLHARGPMGLEELTTYKWIVIGDGHIRA